MEYKKLWKHGPFKVLCTKLNCKQPAKHRQYEDWGKGVLASIRSLCEKHWKIRLEKIKLKKLKK